MTKFINVRTVAYASVTGPEIQNAYAYKNFTNYIVNCNSIETVGPLEGYLTNNVYQYFRITLKSGTVLFCHYEDYAKFEELCKNVEQPIVVNLTNPEPMKEAPQIICESKEDKPVKTTKKATSKKTTKTTKTTKKSAKQ